MRRWYRVKGRTEWRHQGERTRDVRAFTMNGAVRKTRHFWDLNKFVEVTSVEERDPRCPHCECHR